MISPRMLRFVCLLAVLPFLSGCFDIFEHDSDVQARQALKDLIALQDQVYKEKGRYAQNLLELEKLGLKYHTGIVYMEIEMARKDKYRAISLPAESTTARVFAYDTEQGGYYEMDEEEVSRYVLGALIHIRGEQFLKRMNDLVAAALIGLSLVLVLRLFFRYREPDYRKVFVAFFLSMVPIVWAVMALNHMDEDTVITQTIIVMTGIAFVCAVVSLILAVNWFLHRNTADIPPTLLALLGTTCVVALFSGAVMLQIYNTYYFNT